MARVGNRDKRESFDSGLGSSPSNRYLTHDRNSTQLSCADVSDDSFRLSCVSKNERDAVLRKLDSSTFNKLRRTNNEYCHVLTAGRWRYSVRQPLYQLELTEEKTVYLTGRKTRKVFPFKLNEKNKYELLRVEPEYITVYGHIFGSETRRLMKKPSPKAATEKWKDLCRFVMSQFGINLDANGNVMNDSEIPKYATCLDFGAKKLPVSLVQKHLENWSQEKCCSRLSTLEVSFNEKLQDKEAAAEELLSGLKFEKVWAPSSHEESIFGNAVLWKYEEKLLKEYSMLAETDPVLMYAALSNDGKRLAVLGIADNAIKLSFCRVEKDRAYLLLRDMFMQITESKDYNSVTEWALNRMLERLRA